FFRRRKQPVGKSGLEQSRPEPIAGPGEVMPNSRRIQSWIDPAKEQLQSARDHVRHGLPGGGEQFLFRWFAIPHCVYHRLKSLDVAWRGHERMKIAVRSPAFRRKRSASRNGSASESSA